MFLAMARSIEFKSSDSQMNRSIYVRVPLFYLMISQNVFYKACLALSFTSYISQSWSVWMLQVFLTTRFNKCGSNTQLAGKYENLMYVRPVDSLLISTAVSIASFKGPAESHST